jgi:uncharacterized protein (DUF58 family)
VSVSFDDAAVERASQGLKLALPRTPHRGRVGDVRSASVGASMEIHDFRGYQPGDDLRQIDWNAVARTGELILRVRQDEVAPRVEVVLDASRSMDVTARKAARACEVALLLCRVAAGQGLEGALTVVGRAPQRTLGSACHSALKALELDGQDGLAEGLSRAPPLRPCGFRVVVSDFLFEAPLERLAERLARGAAALAWVQLLDPEDLDPGGGYGARLIDAESGAALERILSPAVLRSYQRRLEEHQKAVRAAAHRVRATFVTTSVEPEIQALVRSALGPLMEAG